MAVPMEEYTSNQTTVFAGEINANNIGEVVQELYENGANYVSVNTYEVNPLDSESTTIHTGLIVSIRGMMYTVIFGDYLVEETTEFGVVLFPMKKYEFENSYTIVAA